MSEASNANYTIGGLCWRAINFGWLPEADTIAEEDLKMLRFADSPREAFDVLRRELARIFGVPRVPQHPFA